MKTIIIVFMVSTIANLSAQTVLKQRTEGMGSNETTTVIIQLKRPEGLRTYQGMGLFNPMIGKSLANNNATWKANNTAGDSVTAQQVQNFRGK